MDLGELSLRPMSFRPGGGGKNPFSGFGKGAGQGMRKETSVLAVVEPVKKKPASEIIRYSREQILRQDKGPGDIPDELKAFPDLQHDPSNPAEIQAQVDVLQVVTPAGMEPDDRDWRARQPAPAPVDASAATSATAAAASAADGRWLQEDGGAKSKEPPRMAPAGAAAAAPAAAADSRQGQAGAAPAQAPQAAQNAGPAPKIQRAADVGQKAWAPSGQSDSSGGSAKALKAVKGILNKLTPEKFDRLLGQLLENVKSADVLHGTISLVFENAVAQPTFVGLYAMLCESLSKQLPEFPPEKEGQRPISFQRILLNTCQEEFEGAANARAEADKVPAEEKEEMHRRAKMRTLGNIRLIGELFRKKILRDKIVHMCIKELMGSGKSEPPHEEQVEAVCEMMTITGKDLDGDSKALDPYFATLDRWSKSPKLPSRTRFMVRDVLDLRRSKWIPRREALQAKKLEEIHAEAHAELGMLPPTLMPMLEALPAIAQRKPDEIDLFPSFGGPDDDGLDFLRQPTANGGMKREGSYSALMGEYKPPPKAEPKPKPAGPAPAPKPAAPAPQPPKPSPTEAPSKSALKLTDEEREERAQSTYNEYLSSNDVAEAVICIREIHSPGSGPKLVQQGIDKLMDVLKEREQQMLIALLVALPKQNAISQADLLQGLHTFSDQLEDLSLDIPKASPLMGQLTGEAIKQDAISLSHLEELSKPIESAEPRRDYVAHTLSYLQEKEGKDALQKRITAGSFKVEELLKADPEFDPKDLDDVSSFLSKQGLGSYKF